MSRKTLLQAQCSQCGATDFDRRDDELVSCAYCHSVYKLKADPRESNIIISKGANVVIGKSANVIIKGNIEIESGANVEILGQLEIVEVADAEAISVAKAKLQKLQK
ncbi:MAG: hypothetical protein ACREO1_01235 [Arenimonas sp.]